MSGEACICCTCCGVIIAAVFAIILSFAQLPVNTLGLDYSPITKSIDNKVYQSGFYFLGFMHSFKKYPKTLQTLDFSDQYSADRGIIEARSNDGLMVNFRAQFQYQLNELNLLQLYLTYGDDYKTPCIRFAVDVMNDEAANF